MPRYRAGTYLAQPNAKEYVRAAGANPDRILAEVHPIRVQGRYQYHCMWCYNLIDIQYQLNRAGVTKHPDPEPYMTRWQRLSKRKKAERVSIEYAKESS